MAAVGPTLGSGCRHFVNHGEGMTPDDTPGHHGEVASGVPEPSVPSTPQQAGRESPGPSSSGAPSGSDSVPNPAPGPPETAAMPLASVSGPQQRPDVSAPV